MGLAGSRAADGQLTHRQSLTQRRGCQKGRPPATVLGTGAAALWPGCRLRQGEKDRASKGRRRKEERADGIPFEGLFLPQCGMPAGPLISAQQNCLESSARGYARRGAMLHHCKTISPPPLSTAQQGL